MEPGIYFVPELISRWSAERKFPDIINYGGLESYRDFGGIRSEESLLTIPEGGRLLGKGRSRTIEEVESVRAQG